MNKKTLLVLGILVTGTLIVTSLGMCRTEVSSQRIRVKAPNFSLQDTSGKTFKLSNQIGSPVIIFFGTTWCPACRAEIPQFKELFDQYASRGLKCIYIDINESASKVARFARENSFPYIVLVDPNGSVAEDYDIIGVPTITLIDKDGYLTGIAHRIRDLPIDATFLPNNR